VKGRPEQDLAACPDGLAYGRQAAYFARRIEAAEARDMDMISKVGILFLLGVFAIGSLIVAAGGHNNFQYWSGLGFFIVCVLLAFYAVHQLTSGQSGHS
jgi:hypothetical protein